MNSEIEKLQKKYADVVDYANKKIKLAEVTLQYKIKSKQVQGVLLPAINELRSSTSHIARAYRQLDQQEIILSYNQAINHGTRAAFDAVEATVMFYLTRCARFQFDYSLLLLDTIPEDYQKDCIYIQKIKQSFPSKENCTANNYDSYFNELEEILAKLQTIYTKWEAARPELNKKRLIAIGNIVLKWITAIGGILAIFYYISKL